MNRCLMTIAVFAICFLSESASTAQSVFQLIEPQTGINSTATISSRKLDILSGGVIYRYRREPRMDTFGFDAYSSNTLGQVLGWPQSDSGRLRIGTDTGAGISWRWSEMEIDNPTLTQPAYPPSYNTPSYNTPSYTAPNLAPGVPSRFNRGSIGNNFIPSLPAGTVTLSNQHINELWVEIIDLRQPGNVQRIKIKPNEAVAVDLDRDPVAVLYEVVVYDVVRQSIAIDRTPRGQGRITEENFAPKSVGIFPIPPGTQHTVVTLDVYRLAKDNLNPGAVAPFDPDDWKAVVSVQPEPALTTLGNMPSVPVTGTPVAEPPIGPSQPAVSQPSVPQPRRPTPLDLHLSIVNDYTGAPTQQPNICLARLKAPGTLTVERLIWQSKELMYEVQIPYTEQVIINGKEQTVTKLRVEARTRSEPFLLSATVDLAIDQVEAYRSDGRLLNGNELASILKQERTAVWLEDDQQLDPRYLPLLNNTTLVLYAARRPSWRAEAIAEQQKNNFPSTPIEFCGILQFDTGETVLANTASEYVEENYTVMVPVSKQVEQNGESITVTEFVEETRTRVVSVPKVKQTRIATGTFSIYEMGGKRLNSPEIRTRLASPQTVVYVAAGEKVSPWYRKLLASDALVLMERRAQAK
ncbi:hypothetical protein [Aporhodopirellula aestuarii]|uniref:Uncharacterized protein n=1 Tax=Aporhodopirellula aestuarii TaxID=2950107 RepID=A0ABT0TZI8_9BACT|nr:hypothetical protein [Aporhodopirellula aestuarii]MCM2369990.1 hypothetical protein [Aporhodopirellula aestuarii]